MFNFWGFYWLCFDMLREISLLSVCMNLRETVSAIVFSCERKINKENLEQHFLDELAILFHFVFLRRWTYSIDFKWKSHSHTHEHISIYIAFTHSSFSHSYMMYYYNGRAVYIRFGMCGRQFHFWLYIHSFRFLSNVHSVDLIGKFKFKAYIFFVRVWLCDGANH